MRSLYIFTILLGSSLGYSSLYLFHIFLPLVLFLLIQLLRKNSFRIEKEIFLFMVFYLYIIFSYFFSSYNELYLNYLFYIFNSLIALISVFYLTLKDYKKVLAVFIIFSMLQLFFGLLESFSILRLPFSPYSDYAGLFGKSSSFMEDWTPGITEYNLSKPTGFSGNPNTFGFVALLYSPFLCFLSKKRYQLIFFILFLILFYKIDSKSLFLTYFIGYILYYFLFEKAKLLIYFIPLFILSFFLVIIGFNFSSDARIFTVFEELVKGLSLLGAAPSVLDLDTSTGFRSYLYSIGLDAFLGTKGLGLGIGGIESYFISIFGQHTAFHNFFFQLLVDLGIIGFLFFTVIYFNTIIKLWKIGNMKDSELGKLSRVLTIIVICVLISSIAPSGIFYCLPFWAILGFALGIIRLKYNQRTQSENNLLSSAFL